jgi:hypothetical protein
VQFLVLSDEEVDSAKTVAGMGEEVRCHVFGKGRHPDAVVAMRQKTRWRMGLGAWVFSLKIAIGNASGTMRT